MIRTAFLFGGRGAEHEVSLMSAASVLAHLPKSCYPIPIYITKGGEWQHYPFEGLSIVKNALHSKHIPQAVSLPLGGESALWAGGESLGADVIFPLLHGAEGEDGRVAGLLDVAGIPYVGCGTAAGAMGMNKALAKAYLSHFGIPVVPWHRVFASEPLTKERLALIEGEIPYPIFVKPTAGGSSLGASCARDREGLIAAIHAAAKYSDAVLCESCVHGREIEVAVLQTDAFTVSRPGEIVSDGFYDYEAKYLSQKTKLLIPAPIPAALAERARRLAARIFHLLGCRHLARVDFFAVDNDLYFNEINTMPGFTEASMYPRLLEDAGYPLPQLINALVESAHAGSL